jgi:hypothetical protein
MVGRPRQDRNRAVDLLGQHHAHQGVGPGLDAEGQGLVGAGQHLGRQAVRATDHQDQAAHAVVAQAGDAGGEGARGVGLAVLVAGDDVGVFQMLEQQPALGGLAGLPAFQLDDLDGPEAERAAGCGGALDVVAGKLGLRRTAELADDEEGELQFAADLAGGSTDQIFSML